MRGGTSRCDAGENGRDEKAPVRREPDGRWVSFTLSSFPTAFGLCALPLWKHPPGLGDYQIAPLPRRGKGRWRPRAAGRNKKENGFPRRFAPRSKYPWGAPRNDKIGLSTRSQSLPPPKGGGRLCVVACSTEGRTLRGGKRSRGGNDDRS